MTNIKHGIAVLPVFYVPSSTRRSDGEKLRAGLLHQRFYVTPDRVRCVNRRSDGYKIKRWLVSFVYLVPHFRNTQTTDTPIVDVTYYRLTLSKRNSR